MTPKQILSLWISAFNKADANALADLYHRDAINHQVNTDPVAGQDAIKQMFISEFSRAAMVCIPENIFEDGEWAIMEWKDPKGFRGCGFFKIQNDKIILQRGYWDKLSFQKLYRLSPDF